MSFHLIDVLAIFCILINKKLPSLFVLVCGGAFGWYYLAIASPFTDLPKKNKIWEKVARWQDAFEKLKNIVMQELMLPVSDCTKVYEMHISASNFAIRGIFIQDRHQWPTRDGSSIIWKRWYMVQKRRKWWPLFIIYRCDTIKFLGQESWWRHNVAISYF